MQFGQLLAAGWRMRVGWGLIVVAIACAGLAYTTSQSLAETISILGPKPNSCGTWVKERNARNTQIYETWVLGFLTGANIFGGSNTDFLKGLDAEAIFAWIDNYCKTHPSENLSKSAVTLTHKLNNHTKP